MEKLDRCRGDKYALSALKNKRATIASEIVGLERQLRHRKELLVHVDATLKLLDPSVQVEEIPNKRIPKRIKLFRQGELGRTIIDVLRRHGKPMSTAEIVTELLRYGGHGEEARPTVAPRVRGNLAYLERGQKVKKSGDRLTARWALVA